VERDSAKKLIQELYNEDKKNYKNQLKRVTEVSSKRLSDLEQLYSGEGDKLLEERKFKNIDQETYQADGRPE